MNIESWACQTFLSDIRKANHELIEKSEFDTIIDYCFVENYTLIAIFNSIYVLQCFFVFITIISTEKFFHVISILFALIILLIEAYLIFVES